MHEAESYFSRAAVPLVKLDESVAGNLDFSFVLFLDFDGVLHSKDRSQQSLFESVGVLAHALAKIDPDEKMPIVVASDWRLTNTLPQLRSYFPSSIQQRIVGVTPDLQGDDKNRGDEVLSWLEDNAPSAKWMSIDDQPRWYGAVQHKIYAVPARDEGGLGRLSFEDIDGISNKFTSIYKNKKVSP